MRLTTNGIEVALLTGWEGAVVEQRAAVGVQRFGGATAAAATTPGAVHLANFPLPPGRGDFGSGAVERMAGAHVFVSLLEYGPESVGTALFARPDLPRTLTPRDFHPRGLQRTLAGQAGHQTFCTEAGRAFCLYVVLGDRDRAAERCVEVNAVLAGVKIGARP